MHIWLVESSMVTVFAKSQFFPTTNEYIFYLTIMVVEQHLEGNPNSIPIKVINNPTILIKSDEVLMILQVLDTQDVHNRGHG